MTRAYIAALALIIGTAVALGQAQAGISMNGISMNGISMNGISMNGISMNGISMNGATTAKLKLKAVVMPDGSTVNLK